MLKKEILILYQSLHNLGSLQGCRFAYGIAKNISILEKEAKIIQKTIEASPEFSEFENKRIELAKKYAKKDKEGKLLTDTENGVESYVMENQAKFDKEFNNLKNKYEKILDERKKQIDEYNELLETETDIELYKIKLSDVPSNITVSQMNLIKNIINDE